jgi:T5SS/PEP-CTERM-associated repeat protein
VDGGSDVIAGATSFGIAHQGGFATITVDGAGSSWTDTSNTSPSLGMGGYGDVTFNVLNGGALLTAGAHLDAGAFEGHIGHAAAIVSGAGSNWNNKGGDVELEADPNGGADVALRVLDGGQVQARSLIIGYAYEGGPALAEVRGAGSKISLTSGVFVSISRNQGLRINEGGVVESNLGFVAQFGNDVAMAIVDGAGSRWSMTNDLTVGRDGDGEVRVLNGATMASRRGILGLRTSSWSFAEPSTGTARVEGSNSTWTVNQTLTVASNEHGELIVKNGGKVTAGALDVASSSTSYATGRVELDGDGSLVQVAGAFRAGINNQGDVGITNGADLVSGTGLVNRSFFDISGAGSTWSGGGKTVNPLGTLQVRSGAQVITSAGSQLTNQGLVRGDGTLIGNFSNQGTVRPGLSVGTLNVNGTFSQNSAGLLDIEIGNGSNDLLDITGTANLAGTLRASTLAEFNSVVFQNGDHFDVLQAAAGVTGVFSTTILPTLPSNLSWRVDYNPTLVSLVVVPEPEAIVMVAVAGMIVAIRRCSA